MVDEEVRHIPPSNHLYSKDKAKIISFVIKAFPREYMEQFSHAFDAQFGAMQTSLFDVRVFIGILSFIESWFFYS